MKYVAQCTLMILILAITGCAGRTPIRNVVLPPVTIIEGTVTGLDHDGFTLADESGSILVRASLPDSKKLDVSPGESMRVYGNLQGGQARIFDGYVIRKQSGEQVIISNPTPHFGFVMQSAFH